jgi:multidrug transporter EmrE-like cation transporter
MVVYRYTIYGCGNFATVRLAGVIFFAKQLQTDRFAGMISVV